MSAINPVELLPALQASGIAGTVIAFFLGLSYLITAWKGGKVAEKKEQDMEKRVTRLEKRLAKTERTVTKLRDLVHTYRFQRDDARLHAMDLERRYGHPPRIWEPDPAWPDDEEPDDEEEPE